MIVVVARLTRSQAGGCNFCTRDHTVVNEVSSRDEHRTLVVRFCDRCWDELKKNRTHDETPVTHLCHLQGYNPMTDTCPGCEGG